MRINSSAAPSKWHYLGALLFSISFLLATGLSGTWLTLLSVFLIFAAVTFWFKDIKAVLFFGFICTCSIHLTKALIVERGFYAPGLSITLSDIFLLPLLAIWFAEKKIILKEKIYWSHLHAMPLYFLMWMWFSVLFSEDQFASILMCVTYTKYLVIFIFIADYISSPKYLKLSFFAFALGLCAHFAMAFLEVLAGGIEIQGAKTTQLGTRLVFESAGGVHAFRPSGFAGHPLALANLFVLSLPIFLIFIISGKKFIRPVTLWMIIAIFVAGSTVLLMTLSRAGWISLALGVAYLLWFGYKKKIVPIAYIKRLIACALIAGLAAIIIIPTVFLRITESDHRSGESRMAMIHQAALIIQRNPIVGVGVAGYNRAANTNTPEIFSHLSPEFKEALLAGVVHNKYLVVMAETGIIGIVLFVLVLWRFLTVVPKGDFWADPGYYFLALGFSAGIFGEVIFYMFDHFYEDLRIAMVYIIFGFICAIVKLQKQANDKSRGEIRL
jgi:O-antigen ligase